MATITVLESVRKYLGVLPAFGIHSTQAVLYGSCARGDEHEWSDIDLIVIAPEFDTDYPDALVGKLWEATIKTDNRIEPIPCGELQWETDDGTPIFEVARQEGIVITL